MLGFMARAGLGAAGGYAMTGDAGGALGGAAVGGFGGAAITRKFAGSRKFSQWGGGGLRKMQTFGYTGAAEAAAGEKLAGGLSNIRSGVGPVRGASIGGSYKYGGKTYSSPGAPSVFDTRNTLSNAVAGKKAILANKGVRGEIGTGAQWIGNNATKVNKYGGAAMAAVAAAAGAHIGSSAIRSNGGF